MILTTTPDIAGRTITDYKGIVTGEAIMGANIFRDLVASITDVIGGRSGVYETKLREAREHALNELSLEAGKKGADAVIGIDLDYEVLGKDGSMLMVTASGTAVTLG